MGVRVEVGRGGYCDSFVPQEFPYKGNKLHSLERESTEVVFSSFCLPHFPSTCKERSVLHNWWVWEEEPNTWGTGLSGFSMVWPILRVHVSPPPPWSRHGWQTPLRTGWELEGNPWGQKPPENPYSPVHPDW